MHQIKLLTLFGTALLFLYSCNQSSNTPNINTTRSATTPVVNALANTSATNSANRATNSQNQKVTDAQRMERAAGVAPEDGTDVAIDAYQEHCMICHKDIGKGGKSTVGGKTINAADLTSAKMAARSDDKLLTGIKEGAPDDGMPAFKEKLSDDTIKGIIKYIRTLQPAVQ